MTEQVSKFDTHFVALGGDLAYDNAMPACYRRWDAWLSLLEEKLVTVSGRTLPLLLALGNHCGACLFALSLNHEMFIFVCLSSAGGFVLKPDAFTFFKPYFVHEPLANGASPLELKTYRTHEIGNMVTLVLDSGNSSSFHLVCYLNYLISGFCSNYGTTWWNSRLVD